MLGHGAIRSGREIAARHGYHVNARMGAEEYGSGTRRVGGGPALAPLLEPQLDRR